MTHLTPTRRYPTYLTGSHGDLAGKTGQSRAKTLYKSWAAVSLTGRKRGRGKDGH